MFADPVESFFAGIDSVFVRGLFVLGAILAGEAVCHQSLWIDLDWIFLVIDAVFIWADFGAAFIVCLVSLIFLLICGFFFVQDRSSKANFFVVFSASAIYFSPISFKEYQWMWMILIYIVCAVFFWLVPYAIRRSASSGE